MKVNIITENQCKEIVKEETRNHFKALWQVFDRLEEKVRKLEEEIKVISIIHTKRENYKGGIK